MFLLGVSGRKAFNKREHILCKDWLQPSNRVRLRAVSLSLVAANGCLLHLYSALTTPVSAKSSSAEGNGAKYRVKPVDRGEYKVINQSEFQVGSISVAVVVCPVVHPFVFLPLTQFQ